jgi:hypothetical protein
VPAGFETIPNFVAAEALSIASGHIYEGVAGFAENLLDLFESLQGLKQNFDVELARSLPLRLPSSSR